MLDGPQAEKTQRYAAIGKWRERNSKKFQMEFHEASNDAKNASLYVDWRDGEFVSPSERITPEMLAQIISLSE